MEIGDEDQKLYTTTLMYSTFAGIYVSYNDLDVKPELPPHISTIVRSPEYTIPLSDAWAEARSRACVVILPV